MKLSQEALPAYFSARVESAAELQGLDLSQEARHYLVGLLARLAQAERLFSPEGPTTLADLHLRACASPSAEAIRLYRELGDRSLFIAGYFSESLERRPVGVDYYTDMGAGAYHRTASLLGGGGALWAALYRELAARFGECVELISEIAVGERGPQDILRLYELWRATGRPRYARQLARLGLDVETSGSA